MLCELHIKNVAVIDEITVAFHTGFNVLTGETGAGKSILIDALNMAAGGRTSKDLIRSGAEYALVDAVFSVENNIKPLISELGIDDEDDALILSRRIGTDGKSRCRINGSPVPLSTLREIGEALLTIHGQHDNQDLLTAGTQMSFVDELGGLGGILNEYQNAYRDYKEAEEYLASLSIDESDKARKIDLLTFQIDEISKVQLRAGEEEELNERKTFLNNAEAIAENVNAAYDGLYAGGGRDSAYDILQSAVINLQKAAGYDEKLSECCDRLSSVLADMEDVTYDLKNYIEKTDFEPGETDRVEERLHTIYGLKRKYGNSAEKIIKYLENAKEELQMIEQNDELLAAAAREAEKKKERLTEMADILSERRNETAKKLENAARTELSDLDMQKMRFSVHLEEKTDDDGNCVYTADGKDNIEFLISGNPGEALKPLQKIASGGEMSRIMLAMKSVLSDINSPDTLIFDEIDTGVSGRAAQKIAEKICLLAREKQILCITHLAQIAGMADHHYCIEKHMYEDTTKTSVAELSEEERKTELARIIGGVKVTELTLSAAQEMLDLAKTMKKSV